MARCCRWRRWSTNSTPICRRWATGGATPACWSKDCPSEEGDSLSPPLRGRGRGWGPSALRKVSGPHPNPSPEGEGLIGRRDRGVDPRRPRASRYARSEEHTSELQSLIRLSYSVLCLKKK